MQLWPGGPVSASPKIGAGFRGAVGLMAYQCRAISAPVHAAVMLLAAKAREGKLVVCAGAGLSVAPDAGLPSGQRLGELLNDRLAARLAGYAAPADPRDLLAVADAAIDAFGGLLPLQYEVLTLADFERATPNLAHRALALLLAEGAVSAVLLWNWDTCVERSAPDGERVEVALTLEDMQQLHGPSVAKIHGCATRVETLLITSSQLENPPVWADAAFLARLRGATAAFIGIGDVADYAKRRITQLTAELPGLGVDIFVASPRVVSQWEGSVWAELLPELEAERRLEQSADELLDELARVWAADLVETLVQLSTAFTGVHATGMSNLAESLRGLCGPDVIRCIRVAAFRQRFGRSVLRSAETHQALLALGILAGDAGATPELFTDGRCRIGDEDYELVILAEAVQATAARSEAFRRAEHLAGLGRIGQEATFLVAGVVVGPLNQPPAPDLGDGRVEALDIFMGPRGIRVHFISAPDVVARAA
jgi:hypothetical protein